MALVGLHFRPPAPESATPNSIVGPTPPDLDSPSPGGTDTYVSHFDRCLGCMACVSACPSGVQYDKLIEATRAQIERHYARSFSDRLFRRMTFALFPYPIRLRAVLAPLWLYQRSGLQRLVRGSGLLNLLPPRLRSMEALLPDVSLGAACLRTTVVRPAQGSPRQRALTCPQELRNRAAEGQGSASACKGESATQFILLGRDKHGQISFLIIAGLTVRTRPQSSALWRL